MQSYESLLDPCLDDILGILDEAVASERLVELPQLLNLFAFDAIGRITVSSIPSAICTALTPSDEYKVWCVAR